MVVGTTLDDDSVPAVDFPDERTNDRTPFRPGGGVMVVPWVVGLLVLLGTVRPFQALKVQLSDRVEKQLSALDG